MRSALYKLE